MKTKDVLLLEEAYEQISNKADLVPYEEDLEVTCDLPPGLYEGLRYGYYAEINGNKYETPSGIRCTREHCGGSKPFKVDESGRLFQVHQVPRDRTK